MTIPELRMLYKRETGQPAVMDTGRRTTKTSDDYRVFLDYVNWLEEKTINLLELKRKFIPWEPINKS
jgi:hypothetical protein